MLNALQLYKGYEAQDADRSLRERMFQSGEQGRGLQNELLRVTMMEKQRAMQLDQQRRNMLAQMAQGGANPNALMALDPKLAMQMQGMQSRERLGREQISSRERMMQERNRMMQERMKAQQADAARRADPTLAGQRELEKEKAKASMQLPQFEANAEQTIRQIDEMIGDEKGTIKPHPGFEGAVGVSGIQSGFGLAGFIQGTDTTDFKRRLDQLKGGAFMQAFTTLKGGGQITEKEGEKATAAITRMDKSQSEEEFKAAAREFQEEIKKVVKIARAKAAPQRRAADTGNFKVLGVEQK